MVEPFFSIITTSYNYGDYVGATIESVLGQTEGDWELLVIDDGSSDESWDVIQRYRDPRIQALRNPRNSGACAAYNHMLARCRGQFIASLDSDDLFVPERLERQRAHLDRHPHADVCGTWVEEIDAAGQPVPQQAQAYAPWFNQPFDLNRPEHWIWQNRLCHSSAVVRRTVHERLGPFRVDLIHTPDWNFWIRCLVSGAAFDVLHEPLTRYRSHGANITHRNPQQTVLEYAGISADWLHPYLHRMGRHDLIADNLSGFVAHPAVQAMAAIDRSALVSGLVGAGDIGTAWGTAITLCDRLLLSRQDQQELEAELALRAQQTLDLQHALQNMQNAGSAAEDRAITASQEVDNLRAEVSRYRRLWEAVPAPLRWAVTRLHS